MSKVLNKFAQIISKWPADPKLGNMDYGFHLRVLMKNKTIEGNIFPGTEKDNLKMLDSLNRLSRNIYYNKYTNNDKLGASGVEFTYINDVFDPKFVEYHNKKVKYMIW